MSYFPLDVNLQKMNPIEIGICWEMVEPMIAGVIELFPFICKSPKKIESSQYLVSAKKWFIINMTQEWKPLALFDQSIGNICL